MEPVERPPLARVVLLAGPSGSGKSHLAAACGLPAVCLDDFYRDGDDPDLPIHPELGIPDWDDPRAWDREQALDTLVTLARAGRCEVPLYDIGQDRRVGSRHIDLQGTPLVVAEGIFAGELIGPLRDADLLDEAICLAPHPRVTFWRRLARDLRDGRKGPWTLLRRGRALRRAEPGIVAGLVAQGAIALPPNRAADRLDALAATCSAEVAA